MTTFDLYECISCGAVYDSRTLKKENKPLKCKCGGELVNRHREELSKGFK